MDYLIGTPGLVFRIRYYTRRPDSILESYVDDSHVRKLDHKPPNIHATDELIWGRIIFNFKWQTSFDEPRQKKI